VGSVRQIGHWRVRVDSPDSFLLPASRIASNELQRIIRGECGKRLTACRISGRSGWNGSTANRSGRENRATRGILSLFRHDRGINSRSVHEFPRRPPMTLRCEGKKRAPVRASCIRPRDVKVESNAWQTPDANNLESKRTCYTADEPFSLQFFPHGL